MFCGVVGSRGCAVLRALGLSESWFYKWLSYEPSERDERRERLDVAVKASFRASEGNYGSPRVREDLVEDGWKVSPKTVAASMRRQGLVARLKRTRRSLTRPDAAADPVPDLLGRDFGAEAINQKWCGDLTEIPTGEGSSTWRPCWTWGADGCRASR